MYCHLECDTTTNILFSTEANPPSLTLLYLGCMAYMMCRSYANMTEQRSRVANAEFIWKLMTKEVMNVLTDTRGLQKRKSGPS